MIASQSQFQDSIRPGSVQESLLIFADGFYSMNWTGGSEPSPFNEQRFNPTEAERADRYRRLLVNAGRYEIADGILRTEPDFALVPEYVNGYGEFEYSLVGDTLRLTWTDIVSVDGIPDPTTEAGVRFQYTLVRAPFVPPTPK